MATMKTFDEAEESDPGFEDVSRVLRICAALTDDQRGRIVSALSAMQRIAGIDMTAPPTISDVLEHGLFDPYGRRVGRIDSQTGFTIDREPFDVTTFGSDGDVKLGGLTRAKATVIFDKSVALTW